MYLKFTGSRNSVNVIEDFLYFNMLYLSKSFTTKHSVCVFFFSNFELNHNGTHQPAFVVRFR